MRTVLVHCPIDAELREARIANSYRLGNFIIVKIQQILGTSSCYFFHPSLHNNVYSCSGFDLLTFWILGSIHVDGEGSVNGTYAESIVNGGTVGMY